MNTPAKKKVSENKFQSLSIEENEQPGIIMTEKEGNHRKSTTDEPVLIEIGKEMSYEPILPQQAYIEVRSKSSNKSGGISYSIQSQGTDGRHFRK